MEKISSFRVSASKRIQIKDVKYHMLLKSTFQPLNNTIFIVNAAKPWEHGVNEKLCNQVRLDYEIEKIETARKQSREYFFDYLLWYLRMIFFIYLPRYILYTCSDQFKRGLLAYYCIDAKSTSADTMNKFPTSIAYLPKAIINNCYGIFSSSIKNRFQDVYLT